MKKARVSVLLRYRDWRGKANPHFSFLKGFLEQNAKKRLQKSFLKAFFAISGDFWEFLSKVVEKC